LGRVIREVYADGSFGPIYFIRYNRHAGWNEGNTNFPFYKTSEDIGFIEACEALLADKLITLQWWEEDRGKDGFYVIDPGDVENADFFSADIVTSKGAGKAFCFYHRHDGVVVGFWKNQYGALSADEGKSWTKISLNKTLWTTGAKTWAQKTDDGRFAIVHNQSATRRNRYPMAVMSSDDGFIFDDLLCLRGEVPPKRYQGIHKNTGPQYFRFIIEGNGNPPGDFMWNVYSVNKEDMWISKTRLPISGKVTEHVDQDFENVTSVADLEMWNLHIPLWAPVSLAVDPITGNKCLELRDEEPYDYAKVERIFPKSEKVEIQFRLNPKIVSQGFALEIEVQDQCGVRPMRLRVDQNWLGVDRKKIQIDPVRIQTDAWQDITLQLDCTSQSYDLFVNGTMAIDDIPFAEHVTALERIVFRTGPYRGFVPPAFIEHGMHAASGLETEDLPGGDEKAPICLYWIDDFKTGSF
jgi:hypothetical protein